MKKIIFITTVCLLVLFNVNASAEKSGKSKVLAEAEVPGSLLRISKDGTGIIKFSKCGSCEIILVKITATTKFYANGKEISAAQASKLSKKRFVGIRYSLDKKEVRTITMAN